MIRKSLLVVLSLFLFIIFSTQEVKAVDDNNTLESDIQEGNKMITKENPMIYEFDLNAEDDRMHKADGWSNGEMFNNTWRANNVFFEDQKMNLLIDLDGENANPLYSGGEYRSNDNYHYGLYEVSMKPIKNDGVVSSFFTYTWPSEDNPWDEIDIEFLGKDTTSVQFNYFTNGEGEHEYSYELGFDASEEYHTYAFEWLPDSITWFVDGKEIHTATENIPTTPSKVMMNVWPGIGVDSWLNEFDGNVPLIAKYDWFRITQYKMTEADKTETKQTDNPMSSNDDKKTHEKNEKSYWGIVGGLGLFIGIGSAIYFKLNKRKK